jgi:predicted O-linked N-acetylglucosamine transferase (SPINDLY family)
VCYSDRAAKDDVTARFQAVAALWRDVASWSDDRLAEQIRADRIDILFDLAGHTAKNRLLAFARRPAPIQITWAGYVGTTGLAAMDYILADRHEIPPEAEAHYREKVLRMPDGYICYDPPAYAPAVTDLPALRRGYVTFGSFNNPAKLSTPILELWAKVLQRLPTARLLLKYKGMDNPALGERVRAILAGQGVEAERLELQGDSPHADLLAQYNTVDIALDTFPYNGGLTTCEALWMGAPVITLPGETFASRHSLSHLSGVGLTEMVACDQGDYVGLAVALAQDLPRLAALRAGLRPRMAASPLCDGPRFATNLLALLRAAWRSWAEQAPSGATHG